MHLKKMKMMKIILKKKSKLSLNKTKQKPSDSDNLLCNEYIDVIHTTYTTYETTTLIKNIHTYLAIIYFTDKCLEITIIVDMILLL